MTVLLVKGVSLLQVDRFHTTGPVTPALELEEAFADGNLMEKFKTHCFTELLFTFRVIHIIYTTYIIILKYYFYDIYYAYM